MFSFSTRNLNISEIQQKNINLGSDTHISDAKMNPFITFGPDIFAFIICNTKVCK